MQFPYGSDLVSLHGRVICNASENDLDRLVAAIRAGDADAVAGMCAAIGTGPDPAPGKEGDDSRPPTHAEALAYAEALGILYRGEPPARGRDKDAGQLLEDLEYQHVANDVYDLVRRGLPNAALAWAMAHERYPGEEFWGAIDLIRERVTGHDLALVPLDKPVAPHPEGTRLLARYGEITYVGTVRNIHDGTPYLVGESHSVSLDVLHQAWTLSKPGSTDHRYALARSLAALTDDNGDIRAGVTADQVVSALCGD